MKRAVKSGHQKRVKSKRKMLEQSANAPGQLSLLEMFRSTSTNSSTTTNTDSECIDTVEEMPSEIMEFACEKSHVEHPHPVPVMVVVESDTEVKETTNASNQNCENIETVSTSKSDFKDSKSNDWYKGMKLDVDWLLDAAKCLMLKKEIRDQRKRPTVTCLGKSFSKVLRREITVPGSYCSQCLQ